jgi:hypothetical protein
MYSNVAGLNFGLIFCALIAFGILNWLQIPTGSFLDWAIGIGILEWTFIIVTVPWNIYFSAKGAVQTGTESQARGISVEVRQIQYAKNIATRSLIIAIGLHLGTAAGLYWLAINGITPIGYLSSGAVLLLTLLRPAISTYEYLSSRLSEMRQQFAYPRTDILELRDRFDRLEVQVNELTHQLDPNDDTSWLSEQTDRWKTNQANISKLTASIADLKASNELDHQRLAQEAKQAISQITVDGQFLEHARELIRFFKTA